MKAAGCDLAVHAHEVSVLGLAEVVSHLPRIYRRFHDLLGAARERKPDAAILIDFPDFNFRLAKQLHRLGIPVFYFVSPQLWAWRRGRIKLVQKYVRKMLVIFPFEEEFYREHGVDALYVGHPLADVPQPAICRENFGAEHGLNPARTWIALLPGSRRKEIELNLPEILQAARILSNTREDLEFVLPVAATIKQSWMNEKIASLGQVPRLACVYDGARPALFHARSGVVASGTATVEAALIGTPFVMVYRVADLTWKLGHRLVRVPHYGMVNLIAGREVIPELIQSEFTAENVVARLQAITDDGPARQQMICDLAEVRRKLQRDADHNETAAARAAKSILGELR